MSRLGLTCSTLLACGILVGSASGGSAAAPAALASGINVTSISCAAPGDCAAGGSYGQGRHAKPFVVSEKKGTWSKAIEVPGMEALDTGGYGGVYTISCGAPGDCAAAGAYSVGKDEARLFVVSEKNGSWGNAIAVPGLAKVSTAEVDSISCAAAGECAAGGLYWNDTQHAFVVSETHGKWGKAIEVPGITKLKGGHHGGSVNSISCVAPGDCAAGGVYGRFGHERDAFVVNETNGSWGDAIKVPGELMSNSYLAEVDSISCGAAGDCAAGGHYTSDISDRENQRAFVVSEANGTWGDAIKVPGTATLNNDSSGDSVDSISCGAAGYCAAAGVAFGGNNAFLVNETNGSWGNAAKVPGASFAAIYSISCAAAGACAAVGWATRPIVVSETDGSWGNAVKLPVDGYSISCAAAGECAAGGYGSVVSETNGRWGKPIRLRVSR